MTPTNHDAEAKILIDDCISHLREISGGDIPSKWKNLFIKESGPLPKKRGARRNHKRDIEITADWLLAGMKVNPLICPTAFSEPFHEAGTIPDEAKPVRGTLQRIAEKYGLQHTSVLECISRTQNDHEAFLEAMLAAMWREGLNEL